MSSASPVGTRGGHRPEPDRTHVRYSPGVATTSDLERLRRSLAMLAPGQPAGLTREEAMGLLTEAHRASARLDRLVTGLRALLDETPP